MSTPREDLEPTTVRETLMVQLAYIEGWVAKGSDTPGLAVDAARRRYPLRDREVVRQRVNEGMPETGND